jgi:aminobenzoyl-glutamate utilization protein B
VVPEFAEVHYYVRHPKAEVVRKLYPRLLKCAQAGALATDTKLEVVYLGGILEILPNATLADVARANLTKLNELKYGDEEKKFALRLQATLTDPPPLESLREVGNVAGRTGMGSTDVGDVSWAVPTVGFSTSCWVPGTPAHSWQAVACGGTGIGRQGMQLAAKVLAATAWDVMQDEKLLASAKAEHKKRLAGRKYDALLEPGQKPPLDYRDPPRRVSAE